MGFQLTSAVLHHELYVSTYNMNIIRTLLSLAAIDLKSVSYRVWFNGETQLGEMLPISLGDVWKGVHPGWQITAKECRKFLSQVKENSAALRAMSILENNWEFIIKFLDFCENSATCHGFYLAEKANPKTAVLNQNLL